MALYRVASADFVSLRERLSPSQEMKVIQSNGNSFEINSLKLKCSSGR